MAQEYSQGYSVDFQDILQKCELFGQLLAQAAGHQLRDWTKQHMEHAFGWANYIQGVRRRLPGVRLARH